MCHKFTADLKHFLQLTTDTRHDIFIDEVMIGVTGLHNPEVHSFLIKACLSKLKNIDFPLKHPSALGSGLLPQVTLLIGKLLRRFRNKCLAITLNVHTRLQFSRGHSTVS